MSSLKTSIEQLATRGEIDNKADAKQIFLEFREQLTQGEIRSRKRSTANGRQGLGKTRHPAGLSFRGVGGVPKSGRYSFVDKDTFPARRFTVADRVSVVPGGSSVRKVLRCAAVICMPPMYINVGAYVTRAPWSIRTPLVGSCAQIGKRVHLSAAAQIGGVLEPVNAAPVIIEDDVFVGGNCGIYEGTLVEVAGGARRGDDSHARPHPLRHSASERLPRPRSRHSRFRRTRLSSPAAAPITIKGKPTGMESLTVIRL